jgi:epsilon-lactone hydrolase
MSFSLQAFKYFFKSAQAWRMRRNPTIVQTDAIIQRITRLDMPSKPAFEYENIAGVKCAVLGKNFENELTILYIHGGGFGLCSIASHYRFIKYLSDTAKACIVFPEYSKIPHATYPTQLNECLAVYETVRNAHTNLILMGDSAGGNLVAVLTQHYHGHSYFLPNKVVMMSPWLELSGQILEKNELVNDDVFRTAEVNHYAGIYAGSSDVFTASISPFYGTYPANVSTLLLATQGELFHPIIKEFYDKNKTDSIQYIERKGLMHVWPLFVGLIPESTRDAKLIAEFCLKKN